MANKDLVILPPENRARGVASACVALWQASSPVYRAKLSNNIDSIVESK